MNCIYCHIEFKSRGDGPIQTFTCPQCNIYYFHRNQQLLSISQCTMINDTDYYIVLYTNNRCIVWEGNKQIIEVPNLFWLFPGGAKDIITKLLNLKAFS